MKLINQLIKTCALFSLALLPTSAFSQIAPPTWLNAIKAGNGQFENGGGVRAGNNGQIYTGGRYAGTITLGGPTPGPAGGATSDYSASLNPNLTGNWCKRVEVSGGYDYVFGYNIDVNNNTYTVGTKNSGQSFYVSKTDALGNLIYNIQPGSGAGASGVCADAAGNAYVTGGLGSSQNLGTGMLTYQGGGSDLFLAKYNPTGTILWSLMMGGTGYDAPKACALDNNGDVWVIGGYNGTPTYGTFTLPTAGAYSNLFIVKFSSVNGAVLAAYSCANAGIINNGWYEENDLAIDSCNNIYIAGHFHGAASWGSFSRTSVGGTDDMFITKMRPNGTFEWLQTGSGAGNEQGQGVTLDKNWDVCVGGYFTASTTFSGATPVTLSPVGPQDMFVAKYASGNGALMCVKQGGGPAYEDCYGGLTVDANRQIYCTGGYSQGTSAFGTNLLSVDYYGDIYVSRLDSTPNYRIIPQFQNNYCAGQCYSIPVTVKGIYNSGNVFTAELSNASGSFASGVTTLGSYTGTGNGTITICFPANTTSSVNYLIRVTSTAPAYCSIVRCTPITVDPTPIVLVTPSLSICSGSTASLNASGATTYSWTPSTNLSSTTAATVSANPTVTTTYTVTGTNASGCTDTATVTIVVNSAATLTTSLNNILCNGGVGSATVIAVGGNSPYTYLWAPSGQSTSTATGLGVGTYTITVTTANGCLSSATVTITQPTALTATTSQLNVTCNGSCNGSATMNIAGGTNPYTYNWSPSGGPASSATGLCAGAYTCTVTDAKGCTIANSFAISQPTLLTLNTSSTTAHCSQADGSANVIANGGTPTYTYLWSNGNTNSNASGLFSGSYTITVTDANGCTQVATVVVPSTPGVNVSSSVNNNVTCFSTCNGSATATASGGNAPYSYNWNTIPTQTTATATGLCAGNYTVVVTDANGCSNTDHVLITQPTALVVSSLSPITICNGQSTTFTATVSGGTPSYIYNWMPGSLTTSSVTVNPTSTTTYTLTVSDANNCGPITNTVNVTVNPPLNIVASANQTVCAGTAATISATATGGNGGPYIYNWMPGSFATSSVSVSPTVTTIYTVTVTDNCTLLPVTATVTVTINPLPVISFTSDVNAGCQTLCVNFTNTTSSSQTSAWSFGDGHSTSGSSTSVQNCYATPGTFNVTLVVTDLNGCSNSLTITNMITVYGNPTAEFSYDPHNATGFDGTIHFTDLSTGASQWNWTFGDLNNSSSAQENPVFTYLDSGNYAVTLYVVSPHGCVDSITHVVHIAPDFAIYLPTAFTPNGDGKNDVFAPVGSMINENNFEMWIFDRWGAMIYHTKDLNHGWDGKANGGDEIAQEDAYVWKLQTKDNQNMERTLYGHVSLIR